ncbi:ATP-binding cassette domain-containing protein [Corynebacterium aquilae]|uniref:ABC transporter domain-containing protein n=1 Tax=Corynebacterium aquilae DSM 44791 TaxID=1431546 RepID=A0A1L7CEZ4_9CORY|nr:ATP-binding cassette domain-containing protein [Corynebacterium aquilae]APT84406.1 hypothetical protein CAQU_04215 [Corynebacterium aquilae DSM 44791]
MESPGLQVTGLTIGYEPEQPVITDLSFCLEQGSYAVVAGASGCGKTTIAFALTGLLESSVHGWQQGTVTLNGHSLDAVPASQWARQVSCVWQQPDAQMCAQQLFMEPALPRDYQGLPIDETTEVCAEILSWVGLDHLSPTTDPLVLSGGEQQRLALAAAIAQGASLIILDEPTAALDDQAQQLFRQALANVRAKSAVSILAIDHRPERHRGLADRMLLLNPQGQLVYDGDFDHALNEQADLLRQHRVRTDGDLVLRTAPTPLSDPQTPTTVAPHSSELVLSATGVSYALDSGQRLLDPVTFEVRRGDLVAVWGPNGSGKTTLLSCIADAKKPLGTIQPPAAERISRGIGWVPQRASSLYSQDTVEQVLAAAASADRVHRLDELETTARDEVVGIVETLGLTDRLDNHPMSLSGGLRQRLSLAAALASRPTLLLLDEPTSAQDAIGTASMVEAIRKCRSEVACLVVSHDQEFLHALSPTQTLQLKPVSSNPTPEVQQQTSKVQPRLQVHSLVKMLCLIAVWIAAARRTNLHELAIVAGVLIVIAALSAIGAKKPLWLIRGLSVVVGFGLLTWVGFLPWVNQPPGLPWWNADRALGALLPAAQFSTLALSVVAFGARLDGKQIIDTVLSVFHIPYRFVDVGTYGSRFVTRIKRDYTLAKHQRHLLTRSHRSRANPLAVLAMLSVASLRDSEQLADALDSKGFGATPTRTLRHDRAFTLLDWLLLCTFIAFLLALPTLSQTLWSIV